MASKKSSVISVLITGDNKGLSSSLDDSSSRLSSFAKGAGIALAAVGAAVGAAAFTIGKKAVSAASDLEESINAVNVAFEGAAAGVLALGETSAVAMGVSQREFNAAAVRFSAFADRVVGDGGDVAGFIGDISVRAADFASVFNIEVAEALQVFQSGLAGEAEPLKRFGINLLQAEVQTYALEAGIISAGEQMTEQQKVQARYGLLMQQTAKTAGDFANTSDGLANSQRILKARVDDVFSSMGGALLPAMASIVGELSKRLIPAFERFSAWFQTNEPAITAFASRVLDRLSAAIGFVGDKFAEWRPKVAEIVQFVGGKAAEFRTFFNERLREPVEAVGTAIGTFVENARTKLGEFASAVPGAVKAFTDFLSEVRELGADPKALGSRLGEALSDALRKALEVLLGLSGEINTGIKDMLGKVDWFGLGRSAVTYLIQFGLGFAAAFLAFEWLEPVLQSIRQNLGVLLLAAISIALAPAAVVGKLAAVLGRIPLAGRLLAWAVTALNRLGALMRERIGLVFASFGQAFGNAIGRLGPGIISRFVTFLRNIPASVTQAFDDVALRVGEGFSRFGAAVGNAIVQLVTKFRELMTFLLTPFRAFGKNIVDDLFMIGRNAIDALIRGLRSMGSTLFNVVKSIGRSVWDTLSSLWKISSPSKVFMGIGEDAMEGLALGLAGSERMLRQMTAGIGGSVLPSVNLNAASSSGQAPAVINVTVTSADPEAVVDAIRRYTRSNGPLSQVVRV
jgi:hypothetical protein